MVAGCGARRVGGLRRGLVLGVGWGGLVGGTKSRWQALEARRLRHAERTVLPGVAQSKKGGVGSWARRGRGPSLGAAYVAWWRRLGERGGVRVW